MNQPSVSIQQKILSSPKFITFLVILFITVLGWASVDDEGISTDEKDDALAILWNYELIREGKPIYNNVAYYGTVFPFTSELIFQIQSLIQEGKFRTTYFTTEASLDDPVSKLEFRDRMELKHLLTFLITLLAYGSVAGIVAIMAGPLFAWIGPIVLALMPRFWGHSYFNPRDVPFAALFILGTYLGTKLLGYYHQIDIKDVRLGLNRLTFYSVLFGVFVGIVTGTRLAGCFLLAFIGLAHLLTFDWKNNRYGDFLRFLGPYILMFLGWMITVYVLHPASWSNPFAWFFDALTFLSRYQWEGSNLFNGVFVFGKETPWYYLPVWFLITTPEFIVILFTAGVIVALLRYRKFSRMQRACVILLGLQIAFFPPVAVLRNSTIYDGLRQFLFILPGIAAVAATCLAWILMSVGSRPRQIAVFAMFVLVALITVYNMIELHPYQFTYFNNVFGGLKAAHGRFDTEYAGLSMREGMEWINDNLGQGTRVVSSRELISSQTFADPGIEIITQREYDQMGVTKPFYYLARPRFALQTRFPECPIIYEVERQGVPFTIIKKCD